MMTRHPSTPLDEAQLREVRAIAVMSLFEALERGSSDNRFAGARIRARRTASTLTLSIRRDRRDLCQEEMPLAQS